MIDDYKKFIDTSKEYQLANLDMVEMRFLVRNISKSIHWPEIREYPYTEGGKGPKGQQWVNWLHDKKEGHLCPICNKGLKWRGNRFDETCSKSCMLKLRYSKDSFIEQQKNKISIDSNRNLEYISGYDGSHSYVTIKNNTCGCIFTAQYLNLKTNENYCPIHGVEARVKLLTSQNWNDITISKGHQQICDYLDNLEIKYEVNNRTILDSNRELDIVIDNKKFAIEYNGMYWHSYDISGDKKIHYDKSLECEVKGYTLLHVFEDHWVNKNNIVKSMIRNKLGLCSQIYARKCTIEKITPKEAQKFFNNNHLQGHAQANTYVSLKYNNEIVSVMSFGRPRFNKTYEWEIIRFANILNTNVVGGASRLFKFFINEFKPKNVLSYSSCDIGNGTLYENLGFTFIERLNPGYFYYKDNIRYPRQKFQKHKLTEMKSYSSEKTESQIMSEERYFCIYDAGNKKWVWENPETTY